MCSCHFSFRCFPWYIYLPSASTSQSLKTAFDSVMRGYKKLPESWLLIEWQMPTGSSGVWASSGQGEEKATSSISEQLDTVMTHPVPSYKPTLFPWWSTNPIPAERAPLPWWMWDWAGDKKGLQQFGVTALCCTMPRGTGTFVWPPAECMTHCSAPLAQCNEAQRLRHGKPLVALSSALYPA